MRSLRRQVRSRASVNAGSLVCSVALASCMAFAQATPDPPAAGQASPDATPEKQGARIEMEQVEVDLGQLVRGETAEARFAIHNRGDEILRIVKAKPG